MALTDIDRHDTDILIIGAGGAGLFAALHAQQTAPEGTKITIAVKGLIGKCGCTRMVQGGYNVALGGGGLSVGEPVWRAEGCDACHGDGYRGRAGLYEVVAVDDRFQAMIHDGSSEAQLERHARADNPSLLDDGIAKLRAGITTVEEVARVTREEA